MSRYLTATYIPELIRECMQRSSVKDVIFSEVYPKDPVKSPSIVWSIFSRVLGREGKEHLKPRARKVPEDVALADTIYFGQWTTVLYQFDIFAPSDQEANDIMEKFERFILEATPTLMRFGVSEIIFEQQLKDDSIDAPSETSVRSLRYIVIFDLVYPIQVKRIKDIELVLHMSPIVEYTSLVRGSGQVDYLEDTTSSGGQVYRLLLGNVIGISNEEINETTDEYYYLENVDYSVVVDDTGRRGILWNTSGNKPTEGDTYYISYTKRTETVDTSLLKTL